MANLYSSGAGDGADMSFSQELTLMTKRQLVRKAQRWSKSKDKEKIKFCDFISNYYKVILK